MKFVDSSASTMHWANHRHGGDVPVSIIGAADYGCQGVILRSSGGSRFELTVTNAGVLTVAPIACP